MAYTSWSVVYGEQPSAAKWNILGTNDAYFDSLVGSGTAWESFTPTWTSSGTAPSIGNGTFTGYKQTFGKTQLLRLKFVGGSTTTWGTGNYYIGLPAAGYSGIAANDGFILNGYLENNGVAAGVVFGARMLDASKFYVLMNYNSGGSVGNIVTWAATYPFTWGTGDYWSATGVIEIA